MGKKHLLLSQHSLLKHIHELVRPAPVFAHPTLRVYQHPKFSEAVRRFTEQTPAMKQITPVINALLAREHKVYLCGSVMTRIAFSTFTNFFFPVTTTTDFDFMTTADAPELEDILPTSEKTSLGSPRWRFQLATHQIQSDWVPLKNPHCLQRIDFSDKDLTNPYWLETALYHNFATAPVTTQMGFFDMGSELLYDLNLLSSIKTNTIRIGFSPSMQGLTNIAYYGARSAKHYGLTASEGLHNLCTHIATDPSLSSQFAENLLRAKSKRHHAEITQELVQNIARYGPNVYNNPKQVNFAGFQLATPNV